MNSSNSTGPSATFEALSLATTILESYLIRITSALGVLVNVFGVVILSNKKLTHKFYNYFWCRSVCNLLVCLVGAGYIRNDGPSLKRSYVHLYYAWYIINLPLRIVFNASAFSDLFLIMNRYFLINGKKNMFSQLSKARNMILCFIVPVPISVLAYCSIKIIPSDETGFYEWTLSEFGRTTFLSIFAAAIYLLETLIPISSLVILNIISVKTFREVMRKKNRITQNNKATGKSERKFSKMVFILTTVVIITRSMDMVTGVVRRLIDFANLDISDDFGMLALFLKHLTLFFLFGSHSFDSIVLFKLDKNIYTLVRDVFGLKEVCIIICICCSL